MAEGHRERLRQRFVNEQIDDLPEYVVLEMMLQGVIARRDTCELARTLIKSFGSIAQVIDAPIEELVKIPGMGKAAAFHLKLIPKFYRRYALSKWDKTLIFHDSELAGRYLADKFIGYTTEAVFMICMDVNCRMLQCVKVFEGNVNAVEVSVRTVVEVALKFNSSRVIIAHNHLGGNALPSAGDISTTQKLYEVLASSGVVLDDHIIVADDDFVSLAQSGYVNHTR